MVGLVCSGEQRVSLQPPGGDGQKSVHNQRDEAAAGAGSKESGEFSLPEYSQSVNECQCIAVRVNERRSSESPLKFTSVLSAGSGVSTVRQRLSVLPAQCSDGYTPR